MPVVPGTGWSYGDLIRVFRKPAVMSPPFRQEIMRTPPQKTPRAWQRMLSGRRLDILDPSPVDIEIDDIAHGLARVARWNGQTTGSIPFNVAQHSILVEALCVGMKPGWPSQWRLAALLHDAAEYVIGDMISPFKAQLGGEYTAVEQRVQQAVHLRFGLPAEIPDTVKNTVRQCDRASAYFEATQLAGFTVREASALFKVPRTIKPFTIRVMNADEAQAEFLERFHQLMH